MHTCTHVRTHACTHAHTHTHTHTTVSWPYGFCPGQPRRVGTRRNFNQTPGTTKSILHAQFVTWRNWFYFGLFIRAVYGNSKVKVGIHQGSAFSTLLFMTVVEALSREFRVALLWDLVYTENPVVIAETENDLIKRLNEWKDNAASLSWNTSTHYWSIWHSML